MIITSRRWEEWWSILNRSLFSAYSSFVNCHVSNDSISSDCISSLLSIDLMIRYLYSLFFIVIGKICWWNYDYLNNVLARESITLFFCNNDNNGCVRQMMIGRSWYFSCVRSWYWLSLSVSIIIRSESYILTLLVWCLSYLRLIRLYRKNTFTTTHIRLLCESIVLL